MATLASFDLTLAPKPETTPATVFTANLVSSASSFDRFYREQSLLESRSSYNHFHLNKRQSAGRWREPIPHKLRLRAACWIVRMMSSCTARGVNRSFTDRSGETRLRPLHRWRPGGVLLERGLPPRRDESADPWTSAHPRRPPT